MSAAQRSGTQVSSRCRETVGNPKEKNRTIRKELGDQETFKRRFGNLLGTQSFRETCRVCRGHSYLEHGAVILGLSGYGYMQLGSSAEAKWLARTAHASLYCRITALLYAVSSYPELVPWIRQETAMYRRQNVIHVYRRSVLFDRAP